METSSDAAAPSSPLTDRFRAADKNEEIEALAKPPASDIAEAALMTRAIVIDRPAREAYTPDVLRLESRPLRPLRTGEIRIEVLYLSIDPTNRNWLKLEPANTVRQKIGRDLKVGDAMVGEALGRVVESADASLPPGSVVAGVSEWQEQAIVPAARMRLVPRGGGEPLASHLTIFSHIGVAAVAGLDAVARLKPGETVVVSAAAGATGRLAVAVAAARGCRVIGIAGGAHKCAQVMGLGAAAAIDYKAEPDLAAAVQAAAPEGVDVFFDGVGGHILNAVLTAMNMRGRVAVCGVISEYDRPDQSVGVRNLFLVLIRELRLEGFLAASYWDQRDRYYSELRILLQSGRIRHEADESVGLETAPQALSKLFDGTNVGKVIVRVCAKADERA